MLEKKKYIYIYMCVCVCVCVFVCLCVSNQKHIGLRRYENRSVNPVDITQVRQGMSLEISTDDMAVKPSLLISES